MFQSQDLQDIAGTQTGLDQEKVRLYRLLVQTVCQSQEPKKTSDTEAGAVETGR